MSTVSFHHAAARLLLVVAAVFCAMPAAFAARVAVLSNAYVAATASDFAANIPGHTFSPIDTSVVLPTLEDLTANYDIVLLFEDRTYAGATAVGNVVAAFAGTGRAVVLGTFYEQDRSDAPGIVVPHGWGALEALDPNTTDGVGTPGLPRTLNTATLVGHPLTSGITSLSSAGFAGGNSAKTGTVVVAQWTEPNAQGGIDPAIAYRITGAACVIHVAIAPHYPALDPSGGQFEGDFYQAWRNAFAFGEVGCVAGGLGAAQIPTLSQGSLVATILLLLALAWRQRRRFTRSR